ncbi:cytidine deaminase-like protein [Hymenopellis radicata]|nr:cytidine deaminase-like protein [Hymenopellis radicata]
MAMSMTEEHTRFMQSALDMAGEALAAGEVPVGCVFVRDGEIIAKARNRTNELRNATRHAELEAIDQILADASLTPTRTPYALSTTTLYVTVEPCIMCASALRQMGIKEVFYGCANERFGGCEGVLPLQHPAHPAYRATGGFLREEAIMILRRFYITENTKVAPVPKSKANRVLKTDIQPLANPSEGKTARVELPGPSPEPEEPGAQIADEEQDPLAGELPAQDYVVVALGRED